MRDIFKSGTGQYVAVLKSTKQTTKSSSYIKKAIYMQHATWVIGISRN